ncbi:hypothetical protein C8J56DRAFT_1140388 [Mycena floridula]|nr:hypothetical protein C8J56DRAFT_1140388 [Mycena floridula]
MPMLSLADLLNPTGTEQALNPVPLPASQPQDLPPGVTVQHNVQLNHYTTLTELHSYPPSFLLEYPCPGLEPYQSLGHLVTMESLSWSCPSQDFAYSLGDPKGGSSNVKVYPLTNNKGEQVHCQRCYSTCQGIKAWVWDYTFNKVHAQRSVPSQTCTNLGRPLETWIPMSMSIGSFGYWIENKIQSKFTIQSLCHQESFILLDIWKAGDTTMNIIESSNRDVNQEGIGCSLVGGTISGKSYDLAKLNVQENHNATGIPSSYRPGHIQ